MLTQFPVFAAAGAAFLLLGALGTTLGPNDARAQGAGPGERETFQQVLLVPPDDKDYVVVKVPAGFRAVVTDIVAYNVANGKGHKVAPEAESYLWLGGYVEKKSVALANRMRVLGNTTEQWHLQTGFELRGAPDLLVSSEMGGPTRSPALVYVTGYLTK